MRALLKTAVVLTVTPVALALPVVSRPAPRPHAVAPTVREHAVGGIDTAAARSVAGWGAPGVVSSRPLALTRAAASEAFEALGVTWTAERGLGEVEVLARVRQNGAWSPWHALDADDDHAPDATLDESHTQRGGTAPWYAGRADGWQVRLAVSGGRAPRDVRVSLVDPGTSAADATIGRSPVFGASAEAAPSRPSIITRAQWGADESLRDGSPSYSDTIHMGFVHHTDTSNSYSMAQAASMVRSVYAFHTRSRGWSDIGYNFLVDKYGRVFEGRYGGVDRPVIGAHTGGFNTDTFGVSLLGNYTSAVPSAAQLSAVQRTFAWKFSLHYVNPTATSVMTSRGGSKYESGTKVRFHNVSGHRDAGLTACPGSQTYARLPSIRSNVKKAMGASLYKPAPSTTTPLYLTATGVTLAAGVPSTQSWQLDVRNQRTGAAVKTLRGSASSALTTTWDLKDTAGQYVLPDRYELVLSSWTSATRALPYKVRVDVVSPLPNGATLGSEGVPFAVVEGGRLHPASPALLAALRQAPPLPAYAGSKAALGVPLAGPRDGMYVRNAAGAAWLVVDGLRRPVTSAVASSLGLPAAKTLPQQVLDVVAVGTPWTRTDAHPDGTIVTSADGAWRIESGVRRAFTSPAARAAWAKSVATAVAKPVDLALPLGAPLAPPEGYVLKRADGTLVVASNGTWRHAAAPLGYATTVLATPADLAALPLGAPLEAGKHPSGALLRSGTTSYVEVLGPTRRVVDPSMLAYDARVPVSPAVGELNSLVTARWTTPNGVAGRALDGTVRVVENGRLVTVPNAHALGYDAVTLPALEGGDFGPMPEASALSNPARHPSGSLVTDGTETWVLDAGTRRPVAASLLATYLGRPALPATAADLALPAGPAAPPANGAWVRTADGARWLVLDGVRRSVPIGPTRRLGLIAVPTILVTTSELTASTVLGSPVP